MTAQRGSFLRRQSAAQPRSSWGRGYQRRGLAGFVYPCETLAKVSSRSPANTQCRGLDHGTAMNARLGPVGQCGGVDHWGRVQVGSVAA
ncbi:hypothetical protein E2C01_085450 [Portunus trituberculatus]|uniref:Uncharacterized protein n=1 Tax=Portunus trituberculatus TaxID=210409 RepID=A0A5B7J2R4_PORTR|nr:hypothetical protein [Portunus trituberculatus]